jgi:hypothetical protein
MAAYADAVRFEERELFYGQSRGPEQNQSSCLNNTSGTTPAGIRPRRVLPWLKIRLVESKGSPRATRTNVPFEEQLPL